MKAGRKDEKWDIIPVEMTAGAKVDWWDGTLDGEMVAQ